MTDRATPTRRFTAEVLGTAFLLAAVVGSGIMAERLAGGNVAIALLCNTIPTGAILFVLITMLGPISGAHFNPAVTAAFALRGEITPREAMMFLLAQVAGGIIGVFAAHMMFDEAVLQLSVKARTGPSQWFSETIATFGLVTTIFLTLRARPEAVATSVALYITAAYWFTASTSFANPAVSIARGFTDTFAGIDPAHVPAFVLAQLVGAVAAVRVCGALLPAETNEAAVPSKARNPNLSADTKAAAE